MFTSKRKRHTLGSPCSSFCSPSHLRCHAGFHEFHQSVEGDTSNSRDLGLKAHLRAYFYPVLVIEHHNFRRQKLLQRPSSRKPSALAKRKLFVVFRACRVSCDIFQVSVTRLSVLVLSIHGINGLEKFCATSHVYTASINPKVLLAFCKSPRTAAGDLGITSPGFRTRFLQVLQSDFLITPLCVIV